MTESGLGAPPLVNSSNLPTLAAPVSSLIALSVLAGWTFGIASLKSLLPGAVEMKVNTAIALLCSALIGLATLAEYVFEWAVLNEVPPQLSTGT